MTQLDRRVFLAASATTLLPTAAVSGRSVSGGWSLRSAMPWAVQEVYAATVNGHVVVAGGLAGRADAPLHIEDRAASYDPVADRWTELPPLPAARHHPMVVTAGGALLIVGGYGRSASGDWTAMTEAWLADGEVWSPAASLPRPLSETVGLELAGLAHLVTGRRPTGRPNGQWTDHGDVADHWVYDRAADRWDEARPAPFARNSAAGAVLDGAMWIAGGRTVSGGGTGRLDRYDPTADRWDTLAPIPLSPATGQQVGGGLAMAALEGKLVAFGGEWFAPRGGGVFAETWIYDPARDAWEQGPDMVTPRHGLAAATVGDAIFALAGGAVVSGGRAVATVEAFRF